MNRPTKKIYLTILLLVALTLPANHLMGQSKLSVKQPVLGIRSAKIIQKDGLKFKDLNRNGQVDKYEDWRLSAEERSKDLLAKMSLEQKVGFMLISTTRLKNDQSFQAPQQKSPLPAISTKRIWWPTRICSRGSHCLRLL